MAKSSVLVLDGNEVKLRLQAERVAHKTPVHVDWLRFTVFRRNTSPSFESFDKYKRRSQDDCLPVYQSEDYDYLSWGAQSKVIQRLCKSFEAEHQDPDFVDALHQSLDLANEVCKAMGEEFAPGKDLKNGKDFYKFRLPIERDGHECGWVGFLASSDSPSQLSQAQTIHVNIEGFACTFAAIGWPQRMAKVVDIHEGKITRVDLALDYFDGLGFSFSELQDQYKNGVFDVRGKRPKSKIAGDWFNDCERSLYIGCRKSGKETNIYEKGDQLFGRDSHSPWVRAELRLGNKLRVLDSEILRRPADFFAGASDWHALQIARMDASACPQSIPQEKQLERQTVLAEATRNIRWALTSAAPTVAAAFRFLSNDAFIELCDWTTKKLPGRLQKFTDDDLRTAFSQVMGTISTPGNIRPVSALAH